MDERTMQLRLGAAVLVSLVIVVIMLTFLGTKSTLFSSNYNIKIRLSDAPGVTENTPIYQNGILIGRVRKVVLEEDGVTVTANIFGGNTLYTDQLAHLSTTLLGDASLKIVRMPRELAAPKLFEEPRQMNPGEIMEGKVAFDPVVLIAKLQDRLSTAITDVSRAATQLETVAGSANEMIQENRQNVQNMIQTTSSLVTDSHSFIKEVSGFVNDDELQESIRTTIVRMPQMLEKMDATVDSMRLNMNSASERLNVTMTDFSARIDTSLGLADKALTNVLKITDPIASKTEIWLGNVDNILQNLDVFTESIVNKEGTVGRLLRDRTVYDRLNQTMDRVNYLTKQMEPILFNAQVFSEKIAQHPELLGVRGALFPNPGTSREVSPPRGMSLFSGGNGFLGMTASRNTEPIIYGGTATYDGAVAQPAPARSPAYTSEKTIVTPDEIMFPDIGESDSEFLNTLYDAGGNVEYVPVPAAKRTAPAEPGYTRTLKPASPIQPAGKNQPGLKPATHSGVNYQAR